LTLALILTFSPGEKEQRLGVLALMNDQGANPAADICKSGESVKAFSLGERVWVREDD
jgi:hypothetical protein